MLNVLSVLGTRPEAVKLAPVILELAKHPDHIRSRVCVTAQHREMLDQVLDLFGIVPDVDLNLMQPGQTLPELTARVIRQMSVVLQGERPDIVLVQGDTTTVMAAALAAFYQQIPVGHVEAGLRTHNRYSPFPEEINRCIAGVLSTLHFAPTETARRALLREGVADGSIHVTGNTVIDALLSIVDRPQPAFVAELLDQVGWQGVEQAPRLVLVTAHRRENLDRFDEICQGILSLVQRNPAVVVVYPVHLNPRVREPVFRILRDVERVVLTDPVEYDVMAHLMHAAYLVLTDSGGIQEEAPALGTPVLVMRTETERPEAVEAGTVKLVGPVAERIVHEAEGLLHDPQAYRQMAQAVSPYGDGHASERIAEVLIALDKSGAR